MAIITEDRQSGSGIMGVLIWMIVLILIGVGAYYIFFVKPPLTSSLEQSDDFKKVKSISSAKLDTKEIIDKLGSLNLKNYITWEESENKGRTNPFLPI